MKINTINIVLERYCPKRRSLLIKISLTLYVLFLINFFSLQSFAQTRPVLSGIVYSAENKQPLPGAVIAIDKNNLKTTSDADGKFQLFPIDTTGELKITFIGFQTNFLKYSTNTGGPILIYMSAGNNQLQEVVVSTGYQVLPKERATGSFVNVNNELINRRVSTDILSRLEGVVPGLMFNRNTVNGSAGQVDINIRGVNTFFANNQPLIVVDGFPYDGTLNNINPNDIESVNVLKDAAAASIWGVRSGNGVIIITTKNGKRNQKLSIELNTNVTIGQRPDLYYTKNRLNTSDFIDIERNLFNLGFYNSQINTGFQPVTPVVQLLADARAGKITANAAADQINALRNLDVRDQITKFLYQPSVNQQYALNLKGGNEKSDYFVSIGDNRDRSNLKGNLNNRFTLNSLINFYPTTNLKLTTAWNHVESNVKTNSPINNYGLNFGTVSGLYPYAQIVDGAGNGLSLPLNYSLAFSDAPGNANLLDWHYRPIDELNLSDITSTTIDNRLNFGVSYKLPKGFTADVKYTYERANSLSQNSYSADTYYARNLINRYSQAATNGTLSYPIPLGGILQQSSGYLTSHRGRAQANFSNTWNQLHELNAIIGSEISDIVNESNSNTVYGYNKDSQTSNASVNYTLSYRLNPTGAGSGLVPTQLGFAKTTNRFISYYSNAAYTYRSRYTISLSGRIDKSNLFGVNTNQKAVPLYSAGVSWIPAKEGFYHIDWLPYLKLRATFGYNGNVNTNATAVMTTRQFASNINQYYAIPFAQVANPGNPELRWERSRMINFGLDFASKRNVISGSIEVYRKKGIDLFGNSSIAPQTGLTTFFGNTANTTGNGIDIVINSKNIDKGHWQWTTNFLYSRVVDKVSAYGVTGNASSYVYTSNPNTIVPLIGKSLYGIYSFEWGGLTNATGDPQGYLNGQPSTNYNSILSTTPLENMVYHGSSRPTSFGSLRNTVSFYNVSLSANIIYKFGYYFRRNSYTSGGLPFSGHTDYYSRWQKPGDELITNIPAVQNPPYNSNRDMFYRYSSTLVDIGDHIRLQDITLSYDISKDNFKKLPVKQLNIYLYTNNMGILWRANKHGLDPDLSSNISSGEYPLPKTYAIGIKANF